MVLVVLAHEALEEAVGKALLVAGAGPESERAGAAGHPCCLMILGGARFSGPRGLRLYSSHLPHVPFE